MIERWLPMPGHEGYYEVSDLGRARSLDRTVMDSAGRKLPIRGRTLTMTPRRSDGRILVTLYRDGRIVQRKQVHRAVLEAFVGPAPAGMECCHNDGDPANNRLSNLRWGTRAENMQDTLRHGTNPQRSKTHCPQGHPYDEANTMWRDGRRRSCRTCHRARGRAYWEAAKSARGAA